MPAPFTTTLLATAAILSLISAPVIVVLLMLIFSVAFELCMLILAGLDDGPR